MLLNKYLFILNRREHLLVSWICLALVTKCCLHITAKGYQQMEGSNYRNLSPFSDLQIPLKLISSLSDEVSQSPDLIQFNSAYD